MDARIKRNKNVYKALTPMPDIAEAQWIVAMIMKENKGKNNTIHQLRKDEVIF